MLTKAEITAASDTLDSTDKAMWITLIRANSFYRKNKAIYPDVSTKLDDANGTVYGKMLNAILDKIEALGVGEISLRTPDEGLSYSQSEERDALVRYGLSILYDAVIDVLPAAEQAQGYAQTRQRTLTYCPICGFNHSNIYSGYYHTGICPVV